MRLKIVVLLLFFCGIFSISAQEKLNQFNKSGERIGNWVRYYDNGKIRYQGQFENGKEVGVFKFYSMVNSENPIIIKTFSEKTGIANVEFFSEEGLLESQGEMQDENRIGRWLFYLSDGKTLVSEENYKKGVLNGESKTYYRSGKITEIKHYEDGKLKGNLKRFSDEGILLDDLNYENGKLNGLANYYNTFGKLRSTGSYVNDERVGKWHYFENEEEVNLNEIKQ